MEHDLIFGAGAALGALLGGWCFLRAPKKPLPPLTSKAKIGFFYFAILCIGAGLANLVCGFFYGKVFAAIRHGGYIGWLSYNGHELAFALFGFLSAYWVFLGVGAIRFNLLAQTRK